MLFDFENRSTAAEFYDTDCGHKKTLGRAMQGAISDFVFRIEFVIKINDAQGDRIDFSAEYKRWVRWAAKRSVSTAHTVSKV